MKNIKLKMFIAAVLVLLHNPVFCEDFGKDNTIVAAISALKQATMDALHGAAANSIVNTLNGIFVRDISSGSNGSQSIIDKKIDGYVQNFYALYATDKDFMSKVLEINDEAAINGKAASNSVDLMDIEKQTKRGMKELEDRIIYYDTQKTVLGKIKDAFALLLVPAEKGNSNINSSLFSEKFKEMISGGSAYGSLDDSVNINDDSKGATKDIMNVYSLIGPDSYSKEEDTKAGVARMFISELLGSVPPPKSFVFPQPAPSDDSVTLYLPYENTGISPALPYTEVTGISTKQPIKCTGSDCISQYQKMLNYLSNYPKYQEYKAKVRSKLALRTLYLDGILRVFQNRYKEKNADLSLVEKEKYMASVGLTQTYYNNLKNKSVADLNLETLHTLNKIVYFLHKLHRDNERTSLVNSIAEMQVQTFDPQDEIKYVRPIGALIENGCWATDYDKEPAPNGATKEARQKACSG